MKRLTKKLVILLTSFVMIVGLVSFAGKTIHADEGDDEITVTYYLNYKETEEADWYCTQTFKGTAIDDAKIIDDILTRDDYTTFPYVFSGWSTNKDASPTSTGNYRPGQSFEPTDGMKLYAVWGEYGWGDPIHAAGDGTTFVYDGNSHSISGITETDPGESTDTTPPHGYSDGYYYQPLWYALNVWRYTYFGHVAASGTDVGSYTTPTSAPVYAEIWVPFVDNEFVRIDDTFTEVVPATMTITPAPLKVVVEDQRERYTGSDITPEGTIEGLVTPDKGEQETATLVPESFKEVGAHPVTTYTINWDGTAKQKNYEVKEEELGTLTIYYELKFDANGGLEAPDMMEVETDSATIPTTTPRKPNATFLGWATTANSRSAQYKPGDTIKLKDNTTLYAIYQSDRVIPDIPNTGVDGPKGGASHSAILLIAGLAMAVAAISGKRSA